MAQNFAHSLPSTRAIFFAKFQLISQMLRRIFGLKIPKKGPKNAKKWFFSHIGQTMCHTIIKFCMPGLDLNMYLHENFHWPVINQFFQNSILNFLKRISHFSSISFFDKDRVHIDTGFENLFSMSKFIEMEIFLKVQWL